MASMGQILLPLLMVAVCNCAPANWLDIGGTVGYDSHINGTIGGHLKGERDGLSVDGTGRSIIGASWAPTLIARGHAKAGEAVIAGDASLKTEIDNSWQPGFQGEIGRNSKGEWLLGFQPDSQLYNKIMLTPNVQVKTGDDARKLIGMPLAPGSEKVVAPQQAPMNPYAYAPYGYQPYNPQSYYPNIAYDPNMAYGYNSMAPNSNGVNDPNADYATYVAYYQALAQAQALAQSQSQMPPMPSSDQAIKEIPVQA